MSAPGKTTYLPSLQGFGLYIHIPWCVKKCPYCDFNSHELNDSASYADYTAQLIADFTEDYLCYKLALKDKSLRSIFFGGGTPSLMPAELLKTVTTHIEGSIQQNAKDFSLDTIEVTLEANPGTCEYTDFGLIRKAGINRLSIGAQSFSDKQLKVLGRIHQAQQIEQAFRKAREAGLNNINIDIMYGLPQQTVQQALDDLQKALQLKPEHISWYQLTLEPNTAFFSKPPAHLPHDDTLADIAEAGQQLLADHGFERYEVSAYAQAGKQSQHNLNYWRFGDYLAIGAGAHGKVSTPEAQSHTTVRYRKTRLPRDYLKASPPIKISAPVEEESIAFEFMLNRLRLFEPISFNEWEHATGLPASALIRKTHKSALFSLGKDSLSLSQHGQLFLDDAVSLFLNESRT